MCAYTWLFGFLFFCFFFFSRDRNFKLSVLSASACKVLGLQAHTTIPTFFPPNIPTLSCGQGREWQLIS